MSHYNVVYISDTFIQYSCKYCSCYSYDKKDTKKHLCEDKIDRIKWDKDFKKQKTISEVTQ